RGSRPASSPLGGMTTCLTLGCETATVQVDTPGCQVPFVLWLPCGIATEKGWREPVRCAQHECSYSVASARGYGNNFSIGTDKPSSPTTRQCPRVSWRGSLTPQLCAMMPTSCIRFFA